MADTDERPAPDAERQQAPDGAGAELIGRVANSVRNVATFLTDRRARPADDHGALFLEAEQSLLLGHPLHPTPKSREGLSDAETRAYSPELRGAFPLHWTAVHRSVLAADSAWTERGKPVPAEQLARDLAGDGLRLPDDTVPLPLHPGRPGSSPTAPTSRPSARPACCTTSGSTARSGTPPPPSARSTAPTRTPC